MKYYIIAGEASGDLHGANLMKAIKSQDQDADFRCWGGDLMEEQGGRLVKHYRDLAFMGFVEVILNLFTILSNIKLCKKDILEYKPDALILIDYPGFNLRIAEFARKEGLKVFYYISPQIWAWKQSRVHKIKRDVDRVYVILPFEKDFYKRFDVDVDFVGHPLLDAIADFKEEKPSFEEFVGKHQLENKPIIAILPGSRKQEIRKMLPVMLSIREKFDQFQFVIAGAPSQPSSFYEKFIGEKGVGVVYGNTYGLLQQAHSALVTSGTATLETALFGVPEVVCYKGNYFSYLIAKNLIKVGFISLVNLIMDKEIVRELIQGEFNSKELSIELDKLISDSPYRESMLSNYKVLREKLGGEGASENVANLMLKTLKSS